MPGSGRGINFFRALRTHVIQEAKHFFGTQVLARQVKVLGEARLCYEYKWTRPTLAVARNSQTIIANLPKYAVHGRGATKPPAPVSPCTYVPLA